MRAAILVVVFDFDDTLVPDSTTKLLRSRGIDADKFWSETRDLVARGYDPAPAYLKLLLDNVAEGKPLAGLTNEKLKEFGATLDSEFFPGIPEVFTDLRNEVARFRDIGIEFYINSGGLKPIIEGRTAFVLGSRHMGPDRWKIRKFARNRAQAAFMNLGGLLFHALAGLYDRYHDATKLMVQSARTATPITAPLSAFSPDGRSSAAVRKKRAARASFSFATISATPPRSSPLACTPSSASITTPLLSGKAKSSELRVTFKFG